MSRVMWGVVSKATMEDGSRTARKWQQTTLPLPSNNNSNSTSNGNATGVDGGSASSAPPPSASTSGGGGIGFVDSRPDDGILFGPSGGGNRETQSRRGPRPYFNNGVGARPAVLDRRDVNPYSREHIAGVREVRMADAEDQRRRGNGRAATTEFDEALLEPFLPPPSAKECPRDVFQGRCFFLNSCDADPHVSVYILEKLIRRLGGVTSMSVSGLVSYVVTQHLSSAKEIKVIKRGTVPTAASRRAVGGGPRYIHPHFVLACAKAGCLVAEGPYLTMQLALGSASRNVANNAQAGDSAEPSDLVCLPEQIPAASAPASANRRLKTDEALNANDDCVCIGASKQPATRRKAGDGAFKREPSASVSTGNAVGLKRGRDADAAVIDVG